MGKKFERELRGRMISLEELEEWKKKRDAVILAHYYVRPEVQEIADYMGFSPNTVKTYLSRIYEKMNINKRDELKNYMLK